MEKRLKAMWEPAWKRYAKGKDPQKVADEIFSISDTPTKDQIVEKAKDASTEMHDLFEWDDTVADHEYRKDQAGLILRNLKVEFVRSEEFETPTVFRPVRLFYGNPVEKEGFAAVTTIMKNEDMYTKLLEQAKMEIKAFREKYAMLTELESLFAVIDEIK